MLYFASLFFIIWEFLGCRFLVDTFSEKRKYRSKIYTELIFLALIIVETTVIYTIRESLLIRLTIVISVSAIFMYAMYAEGFIKIAALVILFYGIDVSWDTFFIF